MDGSSSEPSRTPASSTGGRSLLGRNRRKAEIRNDSGRLLAARQFDKQGQKPPSNQNSSTRVSVPKGTKYAAGYRDRAQDRRATESSKDTTQQPSVAGVSREETYGRNQGPISRRDTSPAYQGLVQTRHTDSTNPDGPNRQERQQNGPHDEDDEDADAQLDQIVHQTVTPIIRPEKDKQGQRAEKRTRAEILAELKASRNKPAVVSVQLGSKFRRIGNKTQPTRAGLDALRNQAAAAALNRSQPLPEPVMPDIDRTNALGHEVDEQVRAVALAQTLITNSDSDDDDIFAGAGADYDPLGSGQESSSDEDIRPTIKRQIQKVEKVTTNDTESIKPVSRNYFHDSNPTEDDQLKNELDPLNDPAILAALARPSVGKETTSTRSKMYASDGSDDSNISDDGNDPDAEARHIRRQRAKLVGGNDRDRDLDDIDLGFVDSFGGDMEDEEEEGGEGGAHPKREKLSRRERSKKRNGKEAKASSEAVLELIGRRKKGEDGSSGTRKAKE